MSSSIGGNAESPSQATKQLATSEHLKAMINAITNALNQRQLDPESAVFRAFVDPGFASAPGPPAPRTPVDLATFLGIMKRRVEMFPNYWMKNLDFDSYINERVDNAEVFVNYELSGVPDGVTKMGVSVFRFRRSRTDGAWRLYAMEVANGMGAV